jgi:hypothetical protein
MRDDSQVKILHIEMLDPIPGGKVYIVIEKKEDYRRTHACEAAP